MKYDPVFRNPRESAAAVCYPPLRPPAPLLHNRIQFGSQALGALGAFQVLSHDPQRFSESAFSPDVFIYSSHIPTEKRQPEVLMLLDRGAGDPRSDPSPTTGLPWLGSWANQLASRKLHFFILIRQNHKGWPPAFLPSWWGNPRETSVLSVQVGGVPNRAGPRGSQAQACRRLLCAPVPHLQPPRGKGTLEGCTGL